MKTLPQPLARLQSLSGLSRRYSSLSSLDSPPPSSSSFSLPRNPHLLLPAFWFLFLLTFLQISLVTRSPPRLPFSFYLCLRLLTFSSGYPDGVSLLISNVPPLSLYLLITDPPLSPPTPNPTPYEGEESELQPRRR